jgi:hypothetical protein
VSFSDLLSPVVGLVQGIGVGAVFLLALLIGVCVLLDLPKLRRSSRRGYTRSLDDLVEKQHAGYLAPDLPRGTVDQLRPAELAATPSRPIER